MTTTCARDHDCTCVSLVQAGYNYKFAFGEGGHNMVHGGSIFPDTLRYIWSDCLPASGDEGAGYAGGIVSAAVDGIRVADALLAGVFTTGDAIVIPGS